MGIKSNTEHAEFSDWTARRGVLGISLLPGTFLVTNYLVLGALSLVLLVCLYFTNKTFKQYRSSGKWFNVWLLTIVLSGAALGLCIYLMPQHTYLCRTIYVFIMFLSLFVKWHYSKHFDKDFTGLLSK